MEHQELADELVLEIFLHFDAETLLACSCVNKRWYQVAHTQFLWRELVLSKWPSQNWLYSKVPVHHLNWSLIYKEFTEYNWYTADEMKYFTFSSTIEQEPISPPLREAMFEKVNLIKQKWTKFEVFDHNEDMINRYFNQNMELLFNTKSLNWVFLDKRRGYMEELFKKKCTLETTCCIRPYQVIPSCLVMYRWLCMFRSLATVEPGLTFYRIWRFRLKHIESGLVFELCDWKAAMSSTFSNGKPKVSSFLKDALELLQVITHPHFIMHPLGLHPRLERSFNYVIQAAAGGSIFRFRNRIKTQRKHRKRSPAVSPTGKAEFIFGKQPANEYWFPDIDEKLERWRKRRQMALLPPPFISYGSGSTSASSYVTSDTEMDGSTEEKENAASDCDSEFSVYEYGYVRNCEYYITSSQSFDTVEEQHSLQASIADNWMYTANECAEQIAVLYDIDDESWFFQSEKNTYGLARHNGESNSKMNLQSEQDIISNAVQKLHLQIPAERFVPMPCSLSPALYFDYHSNVVEPIPSALALYRLICMFEVNSAMYKSEEDVSVWNLTMTHKKTGGHLNLRDYNGMFQVYVSTAEISIPEHVETGEENVIMDIENLLSEFRASVTQLLDLLMSDGFSHPYGAIAGAVA